MSIVRLSREVRFGLHPHPNETSAPNGFAGHPILAGLAPYLAVTVTARGPIDSSTGMLVNIKLIDIIVRETAVDYLRKAAAQSPLATAKAVLGLFDLLAVRIAADGQNLEAVALALSPYLNLAVHHQEKPMVRLSQRFEFSAAHRLHSESLTDAQNRELFGRCNNPNGHGHNYELEVTVAGPAHAATGQVMSVEELQRLVTDKIINIYDHKHLNLDCPDFATLNPTVENIAQVLYRRLKPHIPAPARLATLRLWETPKTMCEYGE